MTITTEHTLKVKHFALFARAWCRVVVHTDSMRSLSRGARVCVVAVMLVVATGACHAAVERPTPRPTAPPRAANDVVGIWRTIRQGVLELRENRSYVLISPITKPATGHYEVDGGQLIVTDDQCGADSGRYDVLVIRNKSMTLDAGTTGDACELRKRVLEGELWVYAPRGGM
jgi:hypothetical protein